MMNLNLATVTSTGDTASTNPNSSISSYFSDVVKQGQSTSPLSMPRNPSYSSSTASGSAAPTLDRVSASTGFQEIYGRNMVEKPGASTPNADVKPGKNGGAFSSFSFAAIFESRRHMKQNVEPSGSDGKVGELSSLSAFAQSLRKEPSDSIGSRTSSTVIGGIGALPTSIFRKELREIEREERFEATKPSDSIGFNEDCFI